MTEGEARMEELSVQSRDVRVARDELVDRKATLQVRRRFLNYCICAATRSRQPLHVLTLVREFRALLMRAPAPVPCEVPLCCVCQRMRNSCQTSVDGHLPVQAEVATLELALAKADAEAAAVRERLATPPRPAAKVRIKAANPLRPARNRLEQAAKCAPRRLCAAQYVRLLSCPV